MLSVQPPPELEQRRSTSSRTLCYFTLDDLFWPFFRKGTKIRVILSILSKKDFEFQKEEYHTMSKQEPFKGVIGRTVADSTPWWPEPKRSERRKP